MGRGQGKPKGGREGGSSKNPPSAMGGPAKATVRAGGEGAFSQKRPILRFVLIFILCMALFYLVRTRATFQERVFSPYLNQNARASAAILRLLGEAATASGKMISSPQATLDIKHGCDAIEPSAIFVAAVIASPVAFRRRLVGILAGTAILLGTNFVRIIALYFVRIHWPGWFEIMHVEVFQAAFIFLAVLLWIVWARRAKRAETAGAHVGPSPA